MGQAEMQLQDAREKYEDRLTRATNALYELEWGEAIKRGVMPVDYGATMTALRIKAKVVIDAADRPTK